jgi:hypothetical protein
VLKIIVRAAAFGALLSPAIGADKRTELSAATTITPAEATFFETNIRPVLIERCFECHSGDEPESGLNLDSRAGMLRGGELGGALIPGDPARSLLVSAIRHDEFVKMPPKEKLPSRQVVDITKWVEMGAPWPDAKPLAVTPEVGSRPVPRFTDEQRAHWAFQPVGAPALPDVDSDWPESPIDLFIQARLELAGLTPAPAADERTLIRRATFDLTGLPPTPADVNAFLQDDSPNAFAKVVDRLLASPRYGERWGRHWLDVARYADSNGLDENLSYAHAFRYRDYVISAFNDDKPFARFVEEQIAGDLLPEVEDPQRNLDRYIATGFLAIGPKMLAEDDPVKMQMDIIDEQISTLGQTFMAMTIGCARCHDHKFDPLPTEDYYSLAGIFKSSKTMENHKVVAEWYERPLVRRAVAQEIEEIDRRIAQVEWEIGELAPAEVNESQLSPEAKEQREVLLAKQEQLKSSRPKYDVAMGLTEDKPVDLRVHLRGSHIVLGKVAPRRFPRIIAGEEQPPMGEQHSGRLQFARWLSSPSHPLVGRVIVNRVWHWRFGRGLAPTVDNFGRLGQPPSHPLLLDWLTRRFSDSGGSLKQLHRATMLSSTYRMSTQFDVRANEVDPENEQLWRFRRRRLAAEELRDSLLALGTGLDSEIGGTLLKVKNRAYVTVSGTNLTDEFDNYRRSVYLPVVRSSVYEVLRTFDFPDPAVATGERQSSTVAPQALMMMNSAVVAEQTLALAKRLLRLPSDKQRVLTAFERVLSRKPTAREADIATAFVNRAQQTTSLSELDRSEARLRAWQSYCRVLLSSNEFVYVD